MNIRSCAFTASSSKHEIKQQREDIALEKVLRTRERNLTNKLYPLQNYSGYKELVEVEGDGAAYALDLSAFGEVGEFLGEAESVAASGEGIFAGR